MEPFQVRIAVRGYELDTQGHLNMAVYLQYAEHARWELMRAGGITQDQLIAAGIGPVQLEATIKYRKELRGGDEVDVSCAFESDGGRTFRIVQEFRRPDGTRVASLAAVAGLLDLKERKLVSNPIERFLALATKPEMFAFTSAAS